LESVLFDKDISKKQIEKFHRLLKRIPAKAEPVMKVLKGHVLIEALVRSIVAKRMQNSHVLSDARLDCHQYICLARVTDRSIGSVQISAEEYTAAMKAMQVPPEFISFVTYLFAEVLDGRNASVADGVTCALGRPPRDFADYVRETAATGVWHAGPQT